ncbi:MAG: hypothetical protein NVS4B8_13800 [Herpetosiphon sp.]
MNLLVLLPFITAAIALPFAILVLRRWQLNKRPYLLLWAVGIGAYGMGAGAEALFQGLGWHPVLFRLYYLCGAILTAAWMGQGTLQLLGKRPWPQIGLVGLTVLSVYGAFEVGRAGLQPAFMSDRVGDVQVLDGSSQQEVLRRAAAVVATPPGTVADVWARAIQKRGGGTGGVSGAPEAVGQGLRRGSDAVGTRQMLDELGVAAPTADVTGVPLYVVQGDAVIGVIGMLPAKELNGSAILRASSNARSITPLFNIYGTLLLAGGALYSAALFLRKHVLFYRMLGNILIAVGALAPALGGTLSKAGFTYAVQISNVIGIVVIFTGFIQAKRSDSAAPSTRGSRG